MVSLHVSNIVLSLLIFILNFIELNASRQVTLTCGSDQTTQRGLPGYPGKRGPGGETGAPGPKGHRGSKGDPGQCPDLCAAALNRISLLEEKSNALNKCLLSCVNGRCVNENITYVCLCSSGYAGTNCTDVALSNCNDASRAGYTRSGIYNINVPGRSNQDQVYCDLDTDGGGWMVFQRRLDGSVDFYRNWVEYQNGFGDLDGEFWLGLDLLHEITTSKSFQLRVDLEDWNGNTAYAVYRSFSVGNSQSNYRLNLSGYSGTASDSLVYHNNRQFSTKDRDNDVSNTHCAQRRHGAWWYGACEVSNLNGEYLRNGVLNNRRGVTWYDWKSNRYSMKRAEMKIKQN